MAMVVQVPSSYAQPNCLKRTRYLTVRKLRETEIIEPTMQLDGPRPRDEGFHIFWQGQSFDSDNSLHMNAGSGANLRTIIRTKHILCDIGLHAYLTWVLMRLCASLHFVRTFLVFGLKCQDHPIDESYLVLCSGRFPPWYLRPLT